MNVDGSANSPKSERLAAAIVDYLQARNRGEKPDVDAIISAHPELTESLQAFFSAHQRLEQFSPWQAAAATGGAPTLPPLSQPPFDSAKASDLPYDRAAHRAIDTDTPSSSTPAGGRFGDYEILEEINRGGMGVVFRARQRSLNRIVAIKIIRAGQFAGVDDVQRFRAEAAAAAQLDHPSIVPIYEVGRIEDVDYFSMAFVGGGSLTEQIANGPLPPRVASEYVMKVADAVAYAHQQGIIHIVLQVLDRDPDPITSHNRNIPAVLEKICRRAMEKCPKDRYPSATTLAEDLRQYLKDEPILWPHDSLSSRLKRWWRREPSLITHWVAILAVLVISWTNKWLMNTDFAYLMGHTVTLTTWAALSWLPPATIHESATLARCCLCHVGNRGCRAVHLRAQ